MFEENLIDFLKKLRNSISEIIGLAIFSEDGSILYHEGDLVADIKLVGVAGAAIMHLAEHIGSELQECQNQEIIIRCEKHEAFFVSITENIMLMVILPKEISTKNIGEIIKNINKS